MNGKQDVAPEQQKKAPRVTPIAVITQLMNKYPELKLGNLTQKISDDAMNRKGDVRKNVLDQVLKTLDQANPELAQRIRKEEGLPMQNKAQQVPSVRITEPTTLRGHGLASPIPGLEVRPKKKREM